MEMSYGEIPCLLGTLWFDDLLTTLSKVEGARAFRLSSVLDQSPIDDLYTPSLKFSKIGNG